MTKKLKLAMTTVADLRMGDLLLLPESPLDNLLSVEVMTLRRATRSGRITVWVHSNDQQRRTWRYGTFDPSAPIQRLEFE